MAYHSCGSSVRGLGLVLPPTFPKNYWLPTPATGPWWQWWKGSYALRYFYQNPFTDVKRTGFTSARWLSQDEARNWAKAEHAKVKQGSGFPSDEAFLSSNVETSPQWAASFTSVYLMQYNASTKRWNTIW